MDHVFENAEKVSQITMVVKFYGADGELNGEAPLGKQVRGIDLGDCNSALEKVKKMQTLIDAIYRISQYFVGIDMSNPQDISTIIFNNPEGENSNENIARI